MRRFPVTILLMTLLFLAACGGDDDQIASAGSDDAATAEQQDTAAADDGSAGAASTEDDEDDEAATGDVGSDWCTAIRNSSQDDASPLDFDVLGLTPEELEARFTANVAVLEDWEDKAPPEISDQVTTMVDAFRTVVSLADDAEWDLLALATDPAFVEAFDTAELESAANDIDRYSSDVCGVDLGVAAVGATDPAGGSDASDTAGASGSTVPSVPPTASGEPAAEFLEAFGLPRNFLNDEQLGCVTRELEGLFPDGVPEDLTVSPETVGLFDRLGAACGIGNL